MSNRFKVVITDFITGALDPERQVLGDIADVVSLDAHSEDDLAGSIEDADAVILYHFIALSEKTISRLKHCKLIVRAGVGYDNVDHRFARERGIPVANVPDYGTEEVADSAIGLTLAMTRGIVTHNSRLRADRQQWIYSEVTPLHRLSGRVFGVVGLGRIGSATALRAKAFGMNVIFYDPYKPDGYDKAMGIRRVESLAELLGQSYVVSLHCPLTPETRHMINAATLEQMTPGSYLVNTARGAVVDTDVIPAAVASGRLAGAAIDVLAHEPPAADDPLICAWRDPSHPAYEQVIINPHAAFYSEQGLLDMRIKGSQACRRALCGEPLRNIVN